MPAWLYLASIVLQTIVVITATVVVLVGIGVVFYHLHLSGPTVLGVAVYTVVGTATMCAIGLALTRVATTADSASAIGPFSTVTLAFVSGVFIPVATMPTWLIDVGKIFPVRALADALLAAYNPHTTGSGLRWGDLAVLAAWGAAGLIIAIRFSWLPHGG